MADFKVVVSDPKTKTYQFDITGAESNQFIGKAIGQTVDGSTVGLDGYTLTITGGTDDSGFVMSPDLPGSKRQKVLVARGVGYTPKARGVRRRKFLRGREVATDITQINTKVTAYGDKTIEDILGGGAEAEAPAEE
ncbi:30S ribosomal protein S6 [Methanococcoides methylutens]|uniref:Small ribosomal subunit protein eS6 n=1 Tax=Methanococcoides methylutens TaxID=2226 RepID=A0A099T0X2_METMT|nr:30S ribosomal protein S6e [Methanococcoides methylutens]KGK98825.1 30S ribosomal protein S6 [Methanococcoides methylutens]